MKLNYMACLLKDAEMDTLKVNKKWFHEIKEGRKTIEGRAGKPDLYWSWVGKRIRVLAVPVEESREEFVIVKIKGIKHYRNVRAYLEGEGLEKILPGVRMIDEGIAIYKGIYPDEEKLGGIYALYIELDKEI